VALKKLDEKQKLSLRNRAKEELERLLHLVADPDTKRLVDDFKEKFSICEIVYKVILEEHQYSKTGKHMERLKVDMTQVPYALDYAGYNYNKELLDKLFGSENRVGRRSAKKLRDVLTHKMSNSAVKELRDRQEELNNYMDQFLNKISTFDAT